MKKLFLLFAITLFFSAKSQIVVKPFGIDSVTGLNQQVDVWKLIIDARSKTICVVYNIEAIAPSGSLIPLGSNQNYTRFNQPAVMNSDTITIPANMAFDNLKASQVGQMIIGMILKDFAPINSIADLPKLQQ